MPVSVGVSGYLRNAAVAVARNGQLLAVCEEGRVSRVRDVGIRAGGFPRHALRVTRAAAGVNSQEPLQFVAAEAGIEVPGDGIVCRLGHHLGHAATAFLTSPFDEALILVCDSQPDGEVSVWKGNGGRLEKLPFEWRGVGFAGLYTRLTALLGLQPAVDEYLVEALARLHPRLDETRVGDWVRYRDGALEIAGEFDDYVRDAASASAERRAAVAGAVQRRLADLLVSLLAELQRAHSARRLCVGGGLFFNTFFNTAVREAGVFDEVFVPVNPGNAGVSAGCALAGAPDADRGHFPRQPVSPFLGPQFGSEDIKAVLDNCKLSYDYLDQASLVRRSVEALLRGELVAWFDGRLEWGTRALGNRSIFASPRAPYVLENLNRYLKQREAHRTYGLAVRAEDVPRFFSGPSASPFMECEYRVVDRAALRHVCPPEVERVRVQIVTDHPRHLRDLLAAIGDASGVPVLVHTSFNGFHEPIVCTPRDAVRVFYGAGIDMLVIGNFLLRK